MKIKHASCLPIALAAMLFSAPDSFTATYYVSTTGNDSNPGGSLTTPFLTIRKAASLTKPGDTVYVMGGTYAPFAVTRSGSATGGYIAYQEHATIAKTGSAWDAIQIKSAAGTAYIIIEGFNFLGNARNITADQAMHSEKGSNVTNGNCIGVAKNSHHIIIRNNNISYCPGGGIVADGDYLNSYDNVIHHNSYWSALGASGITVSGTDSDTNTGPKILIHNNVLYSNQNFICNRYQTHPCRITDGEGIIVDSNKASHFSGRVFIFDNTSFRNGGPGIEVYQSRHVDVVNNTTYMNNVSAEELPPYRAHADGGEISVSKSEDVNIINNIIYGSPHVPLIYEGIFSVTDLRWDYNVMFNGAGVRGIGPHDLVADPLFEEPDRFNFRLKVGSPAIGTGISQPVQDEGFDGNLHPARSADRGAYQALNWKRFV